MAYHFVLVPVHLGRVYAETADFYLPINVQKSKFQLYHR